MQCPNCGLEWDSEGNFEMVEHPRLRRGDVVFVPADPEDKERIRAVLQAINLGMVEEGVGHA